MRPQRSTDRWLYLAGIVCVLAATLNSAQSRPDQISSAFNYCLSHPDSVTVSTDQMTLCFDGKIGLDQASAPFRQLKDNGYFVVRSPGGYNDAAMHLSNILREKNATVIIYDYCLSACANFFSHCVVQDIHLEKQHRSMARGRSEAGVQRRRSGPHQEIPARHASLQGR